MKGVKTSKSKLASRLRDRHSAQRVVRLWCSFKAWILLRRPTGFLMGRFCLAQPSKPGFADMFCSFRSFLPAFSARRFSKASTTRFGLFVIEVFAWSDVFIVLLRKRARQNR